MNIDDGLTRAGHSVQPLMTHSYRRYDKPFLIEQMSATDICKTRNDPVHAQPLLDSIEIIM